MRAFREGGERGGEGRGMGIEGRLRWWWGRGEGWELREGGEERNRSEEG